ncbi:hypothetical protein Forpi1262_v015424 [Fusarium oxysporum f. sp. raphani]|uniref:Endonuclease/exonuclease/phosphatase domain-containing protein n=1 Tax=Fusarium oxysporum f. sp. raphani TaxID=96318 RepID=A0A8J5UGZ9_FUSOX|nr:hypothetical protein Forpi1262_v015424 [Fusarium oxysporum f. sp. raphani]
MASATSCPPIVPDPFELGIHTPANLNRGARTALLQNSPAVVNGPVGVPPAFGRTAQTPSSPLNAISTAAATEGAQLAHPAPSSDPAPTTEQQPVSLIETATKLARDRAEEYNAKLKVFQAFCAKFEEAAKQFTTGPEREFAQKFADSFLDSWNQALTDAKSAPAPTTYSAVAASPPAANNALAHQPRHHQQQRQQQQPPHRQGQPTISAPLRVDLRVFIRLDAEAPARAHNDYAIRAHISRKLGVDPRKIPRVLQVRSGWAVLTADITTRDLLVQRQTEWAPDLGAVAVETRQEWFTYLVSDYPRKLTDLYGNEADSDAAVEEEIEIQTGQKPVNIRPARHQPDNPLTKTLLVSFLEPVKKYWRLFSSRPARLIKKTDRPRQCNVCLDYHRSRTCHRLPLCKRCGKAAGHDSGDCTAPEQCANCLGPHSANFADCPARPKKVHGVFRRLTKEQRDHIRVVGAETYRQRNVEAQRHAPDLQQNGLPQDSTGSLERLSSRAPSPAASRAPSCIMVATTPEAEEEPEHPRPGSPRKRRIVLITLNFYRQNDERDALDTLLQWPIPDRCLVAGDFNARHHTWQTGPTTNRGHEIASWASENGLGLLNTSDIPTNPHGNTIDLAFSNVPLAEANVEDHLATSSDHFTLSLTLPNVEPAPTQPGKIRVTTDDELKRFVEIVELGSTAIPVAASSPLELDKLASTLMSLLQSAAKAAGRPARKGARNAPWWTEECALAAAGYRAIRRLYPLGFNQEVQIAKRDFHHVVRRAKRLYWRNLINSFSDSSSVFKAVRWLRSPGAFQPPPLQVDDIVYETQLDKANALRRATLERRTAEDDIQNPWIESLNCISATRAPKCIRPSVHSITMSAKHAERTISYASPEDWDSWSNEFKKLAHAYDLWQYIDPTDRIRWPQRPELPEIRDYPRQADPDDPDSGTMTPGSDYVPPRRIGELTSEGRAEYVHDIRIYSLKETAYRETKKQEQKLVEFVLKTVSATYQKTSCVTGDRLDKWYQELRRSGVVYNERLRPEARDKYHKAVHTAPKINKLNEWVTEWETTMAEAISKKVPDALDAQCWAEDLNRAMYHVLPSWASTFRQHRRPQILNNSLNYREVAADIRYEAKMASTSGRPSGIKRGAFIAT